MAFNVFPACYNVADTTQVAEIFRLLIQDFAFRIQFSVKYLGKDE